MDIELKESLFRFVVPPCIFFTLIFFLGMDKFSFEIDFSVSIFTIIFISFGFFISAIGAYISLRIDEYNKAPWSSANGELNHWKDVSDHGPYIQQKMERKWNFYLLTLNCLIAVALASLLFFLKTDPLDVKKGTLFCMVVIWSMFFLLAFENYNKLLTYFSNESSQK